MSVDDASDHSPEPSPSALVPGPVHRKHRRFQHEYTDTAKQADPEPVVGPVGSSTPDNNESSIPTLAATAVLVAALALGYLGDVLLRAGPWGLNAALWFSALVAVIVGIIRRNRIRLARDSYWLVVPILFFAWSFAWRDSSILKLYNFLALLAALTLTALHARHGKVFTLSLAQGHFGALYVGVQTLIGSLGLLLFDVPWPKPGQNSAYGPWLATARGFACAVPLVLIFTALFAAADATFDGLLRGAVGWSLSFDLVGHLLFIGLIAWLLGGFLRETLRGRALAGNRVVIGDGRVGIIEITVILGLLNLLFLAFVVVQARYLFGGAAMVADSPDLTYAEYARRGFFELVAVATLVLPLLLLAHALVDKRSAAHERRFRFLAGSLVLLLFMIMISAMSRMRLYQEIYGLTELRLYTSAFMGWLALVFAWFVVTVLHGHRNRFAAGAVVSGWLVVGLLGLLNPDALIVRTNAGRELAGELAGLNRNGQEVRQQPLDERYLMSLSADAVPALVEALPTLGEAKRGAVAKGLLARWSTGGAQDWRTWAWSRAEAQRVVAERHSELEALAAAAR